MNLKVPSIAGYVFLKSSLTLEKVGEILSAKIFGGLEFGGRDMAIHEEVPAIFIQSPVIGLKVILDEYMGSDEMQGFNLLIEPWEDIAGLDYENVQLDSYLFHLLRVALKDFPDIEVIKNL